MASLKLLIWAARSALTGAGEGDDFLDRNEGDLMLFCSGEPTRLVNGEPRMGIFFLITGVGVDGAMVVGEERTGLRRFGRGARIEGLVSFVLAFRRPDGIIFKGSRGGRARAGRFTSFLDGSCSEPPQITIAELLHMSTSPELLRMASGDGMSSLRFTGSSISAGNLIGDRRIGGRFRSGCFGGARVRKGSSAPAIMELSIMRAMFRTIDPPLGSPFRTLSKESNWSLVAGRTGTARGGGGGSRVGGGI